MSAGDTLPTIFSDRLARQAAAELHAAWMLVGKDGRIVNAGGDLEHHEIEDARPGDDAADALPLVVGLDFGATGGELPSMKRGGGGFSDVKVFPVTDGAWLLLLDSSERSKQLRGMQQRAHDLELEMRRRGRDAQEATAAPTLTQVVADLGAAVYSLQPDGRFETVGQAPVWLDDLRRRAPALGVTPDAAELTPFLEGFLDEAREFWADGGGADRLRSGPWIETLPDGVEAPFEATALRLDDGSARLVVQLLGASFEQNRDLLQAARSTRLQFDALLKEIDKKELLLYAIVHDLNGPLSSIVASLSLLKDSQLDRDQAKDLIERGARQANKQLDMIKQILEVFSSDIASMEAFESEADKAPEAAACLRAAVETYRPALQDRGLVLDLSIETGGTAPVVGSPDRLERVLGNLLSNALRHSPAGGTVSVSLHDEGETLRFVVEDEGPGVPPALVDDLFDRFIQGRRSKGLAGLGLDFCRTTVKAWGGEVGYEPREPSGSRFWVRLPKAR